MIKYTKQQLTEMVAALSMTNEANFKFVLTKLIENTPDNLYDAPLRVGKLLVFKSKNNDDQLKLQPGDMVQGYIGNDFVSGTYNGGETTDPNNFLITQSVN